MVNRSNCRIATSAEDASSGGISMGIGRLGDANIGHKRQNRFLFSITTCGGRKIPPYFVKTAGRPSITIEDTEINFLNEKAWVPGKATWEPINVSYYDIDTSTQENFVLLSWLASVYDFTSNCRYQNSRRADYSGVATLAILDGCGNPSEIWTYSDCWPTSIKWGDLDMGASEVLMIDLSLRYSQVSYSTFCGGKITRCACTTC